MEIRPLTTGDDLTAQLDLGERAFGATSPAERAGWLRLTEYAGTPVHALRLAGLAAGGSPSDDPLLTAAFAGTTYMLDSF